ncbi:hypothetical protein SLS64_009176 [Diaporthe eres]
MHLFYAKFYLYFKVKQVFLACLAIFEIGSVICATAPTSSALVVGRAIAGVGGAGLFIGGTIASAEVAPLHLQPLIIGIMGGVFGVCSVVGPLSLLKLKGTIWTRIALFDPLGNLAFIGSAVSLLLALQFAFESSYSDRRVIALFVLFGVLFIALLILQWTLGESSTLPPRVVKYRTIGFGSLFAACIGASTFIVLNYLPIWFQVVQKQSPTSSALRTLPLVVAQIISTLEAGILTTRLGHYMPFVYAAAIFMPIGIGLATTFSLRTPTSHWIGYEILIGIGIGAGFQQARVAAQVTLPAEDLPLGVAAIFAAQFMGGAVMVSAAQNVFAQHLKSSIKALDIPGLDPGIVVGTGATEVGKLVPPDQMEEVLAAYNDAIMKAFQLALIVSCIMSVGALGMKWTSVRTSNPGESATSAPRKEEAK